MKTYKVELLSPTGNSQVFVIRGLPTHPDLLSFRTSEDCYAKSIGVDETQDTLLVCLGVHCSLRSLPHIIKALYGALYDEYQTSPYVKEGDRFEVAETFVRHGLSYDQKKPSYALPALTFKCEGVDVVPADEATGAKIDAAAASVRRQERVELELDAVVSHLPTHVFYALREKLQNAAV